MTMPNSISDLETSSEVFPDTPVSFAHPGNTQKQVFRPRALLYPTTVLFKKKVPSGFDLNSFGVNRYPCALERSGRLFARTPDTLYAHLESFDHF